MFLLRFTITYWLFQLILSSDSYISCQFRKMQVLASFRAFVDIVQLSLTYFSFLEIFYGPLWMLQKIHKLLLIVAKAYISKIVI